jgi:transposase
MTLSEQRKYRTFTAPQKIEIVLAGLRGDRSIKDVCREHEIAETLYYNWRDKLLEGGKTALAGREERSGEKELKRRIAELERALGRKTYELEIAGRHCECGSEDARRPGSGSCRRGLPGGAVARVLQVTRQAIYRTPRPRTAPAGERPGRCGDRRGRAGEPD